MNKIKKFLEKEKINYVDLNNYELSFSHSSYTHETREDDESYERLEFLGDSILGNIVAEYLYINFPEYDQGVMTLMKHYVVNKDYLSMVGKKLNLVEPLRLGAAFQDINKDEISSSIYEDVFEALVGAIFLDAGLEETKLFVHKHITSNLHKISENDVKDSKTKLQELLQSESRGSVIYKTSKFANDNGMFESKILFDDSILGKGSGYSKKEAEKEAARDALERMA